VDFTSTFLKQQSAQECIIDAVQERVQTWYIS
jgi:hypothetical protein